MWGVPRGCAVALFGAQRAGATPLRPAACVRPHAARRPPQAREPAGRPAREPHLATGDVEHAAAAAQQLAAEDVDQVAPEHRRAGPEDYEGILRLVQHIAPGDGREHVVGRASKRGREGRAGGGVRRARTCCGQSRGGRPSGGAGARRRARSRLGARTGTRRPAGSCRCGPSGGRAAGRGPAARRVRMAPLARVPAAAPRWRRSERRRRLPAPTPPLAGVVPTRAAGRSSYCTNPLINLM